MKYVVQILVVLSVSTLCFGATSQYSNNYDNLLEWSSYRYDINAGQCRGEKLVDEEVSKNADQYTVKKTTYTWTGRDLYQITCVRVNNLMPKDTNAGEARIVGGGVGQGRVSIEMKTKNSQRLQFQIEVWGDPTGQQSSNMAVKANNVLYMGGQKYCPCN